MNCKAFDILEVVACADLELDRAKAMAQEHQIPYAYTTDELLADPEIRIVVNLTIPKVHAEVCLNALQAGKHVYVEKPLDKAKGLLVGSAPDTFLGGVRKTSICISLIMSSGHESWHPDPDFYYQLGGGPMFDMGPYYLTALIAMMEPIRQSLFGKRCLRYL